MLLLSVGVWISCKHFSIVSNLDAVCNASFSSCIEPCESSILFNLSFKPILWRKWGIQTLNFLMLVRCSYYGATGVMFPANSYHWGCDDTYTNTQFAGLAARSMYFGTHHTCRKSLQKKIQHEDQSLIWIYIASPLPQCQSSSGSAKRIADLYWLADSVK